MDAPDTDMSWIDCARHFGRAHDVPVWVLDALEAFTSPFPRGGPPAPPECRGPSDFVRLEALHAPPLDAGALGDALRAEAEGAQPELFARRVRAAERLLVADGQPAARILRVGLRVRLGGILAAPPPRLSRVRALADFYYSQAARIRYPAGSALAGVGEPAWHAVAPGLEHARLEGAPGSMPLHVNVLRADPSRVRIRVADLGTASRDGASFPELVALHHAHAGISGGFFLYSEDAIEPPSRRHDPVGLLLEDGVVRNPPVFSRGGILVGAERVEVRRIGMADVDVCIDDRPVTFSRIWNRAHAEVGGPVESVAVVGTTVVQVGRSLPVPLNGFVGAFAPGADRPDPGARVSYAPPRVGDAPAIAGLSGGPLLVERGVPVRDMRAEDFWGSAPPVTFSQDETGDRNLLARLAVGTDASGRVLAAAIDGRNVERALGLTLDETAGLMAALGCTAATNLDGGSSKRMCVGGEIMDLPSTEIVVGGEAPARVRPVHTALLFQASSGEVGRDQGPGP